MVWEDEFDDIETTWEEVSTFYRAWLKNFSCSEFDRPEKPICYGRVDVDEEEVPGPGLDFAPLIFQSLYYVSSRKGFRLYERIYRLIFFASLFFGGGEGGKG